jgi:hypothetical protein
MPVSSVAACGRFFRAGVIMPPRPGIEPDDLVTPTQFGEITGVPPSTVRTWIERSESIIGRKIEPLGQLGRWPAYDYNDLAAVDAAMRRKRERGRPGMAA